MPLVQSPPLVPVITLEEAKAHLRVDTDAEDTLIESAVRAATAFLEQRLNCAFVTRDVTETLSCWGREISLSLSPVTEITEIRYKDGDAELLLAPSDYQPSLADTPARLRSSSYWPFVSDDYNRMTVKYKAGYGNTAEDVPEDLRHAVKMMTAHFYEIRDPVIIGNQVQAEMPFAVTALTNPYRVFMKTHSGNMRERVTFQQKTRTSDGMGGGGSSWTDEKTVFARVEPLKGREREEAKQLAAESPYRVTVRLPIEVTTAMRIKWGDKILNIRSAYNKDERLRLLTIDCDEETGGKSQG